MPQRYFLAPATSRTWLSDNDINLDYPTGNDVSRVNNRRQFFAVDDGPITSQLTADEKLHGAPQAVFDDSVPPVQTGWNATVLWTEIVPVMQGGIVEVETRTPAFRRFAVYLIDSSEAKLILINDALQNIKPYYGEITSGITPDVVTRNELANDVLGWRDEASAGNKFALASRLSIFYTDVLSINNLSDFRTVIQNALGIKQTDIDRVQIGQAEEV